MTLSCPHCSHKVSLKEPKPGRYKPQCPKCGERFLLVVHADPAQPPTAQKLPTAGGEATLPPSAPTTKDAAKTVAAASVDQTAPFVPQSSATLPDAGLAATIAPAPLPRGIDETTADAFTVVRPDETVALAPQLATTADETIALAQPPASAPAGTASTLPTLGGYRLLRELGRGAMGAVYLAKQLSLDREVALKTIQGEWASNPIFIARFTREAYAAAQLTHHNVVQIYDLGVDRDVHYFSMEYVRGQSLDQFVKQQGKLDSSVALGYVLQAARGLQYAHSRGLVHRDVKPANLMLSEHGVVKVADLGLVKNVGEDDPPASAKPADAAAQSAALSRVSAGVTHANVAMGTPAYMAPEQAENAAGVDHRADIYSLGCTLYVLLTGRPPFEGSSALEVITKHKTEPVVRPDTIVKRLPPALSDITLKMVAKKPEERYQHLGEAIQAMEDALGLPSAATFSPQEEHVATLERSSAAFNAAPTARLRKLALLGFFAATSALALIAFPFSLRLSLVFLMLLGLTPAIYFALSGLRERTFLFDKVRQFLLSLRISDWLTIGAGGLITLLAAWLLGLVGWSIAVGMLAVALAAGLHLVLDRRLAAERKPALDDMQAMIKSLRLKGLDEQAIRQFVARYSGDSWEEFFEALFGYEAKLSARAAWGKNEQGKPRKKFRPWREWAIKAIDDRLQAAQQERSRRLLQQVEEKNLQAQGLDLISARRQAQRVADAMVEEAAELRAGAQDQQATAVDPKVEAIKKRARIKAMLADARSGRYESKRSKIAGSLLAPLGWFFGPKARFVLGAVLLLGCILWANQNGLLTRENADALRTAVTESAQSGSAAEASEALRASVAKAPTGSAPLRLPLVGDWFGTINPGAAGLVLIVSALFTGWRMSIFALPAAAVMVAAPALGLPDVSVVPLAHSLGLAVGLAIAVTGIFFGRTYD